MPTAAATMPLEILPDDDCCIVSRRGYVVIGVKPGTNMEAVRNLLQNFLGVGHSGTTNHATTNYGTTASQQESEPAATTATQPRIFKRKLSAKGRKAISDATKRRWAEAKQNGKTITGKRLTKSATA